MRSGGWAHVFSIVTQGDDITTYSLYDEASLQVIDYSDDRPIPTGWDLHGLLLGSNLG